MSVSSRNCSQPRRRYSIPAVASRSWSRNSQWIWSLNNCIPSPRPMSAPTTMTRFGKVTQSIVPTCHPGEVE